GCSRKAHAWAQAEESLEHISRRYFDVRNEHGVPFGLLAAAELADVYAASGRTERTIDKSLATLANLEHHVWLVPWKDEKFFAERLHGHLREWSPQMTAAQKTRWQTFVKTLNARAARVQMLEDWQADDWPRVQ